MYTWQIRSQILNLGQNILYIQIKCPVLNLTMRKMWQSNPRQAEGSFLLSNFKPDIFICVCKIFWPKFSIVTRSVYILFVPVYNILHKRFKFGHLTLTIGWICCGNLQPFAMKMAVARIFVELGNSWNSWGCGLGRQLARLRQGFGLKKLCRYLPRCCSYNMTPISVSVPNFAYQTVRL